MTRIWPTAVRAKRATPRLDAWRREVSLIRAKDRALSAAAAEQEATERSRRELSALRANIAVASITRAAHKPRRRTPSW
jgi:hypothetical protein